MHDRTGRLLDHHVAGVACVGKTEIPVGHQPGAAGPGPGQRRRVVLLVPAQWRVAVTQCLPADGRRQDTDGQHRVRGHHSGRAALDWRRLRTAAQVRAVQHHCGGAQGDPVASVGLPEDMAKVEDRWHRVDNNVLDRHSVGHRYGAAGRRDRVAADRVRQGSAERSARARPVTGHRPVREVGPVQRRRRSARRQDRPVRRKPERDQQVHVQEEADRGDEGRRRRVHDHDRGCGRWQERDRRPANSVRGPGHGGPAVCRRFRCESSIKFHRIARVRRVQRISGRLARQLVGVYPL